MNNALLVLILLGVLGACDTIYYHEWRLRLPETRTAARELRLHASRDFTYSVVFGSLAWTTWNGILLWGLVAIFAAEIVITLLDFIEEDRTRKLPAGERVMHAVMGIVYGIFLALLYPYAVIWSRMATGFGAADYGVLSWILSLFAAGVLASGVRDWMASKQVVLAMTILIVMSAAAVAQQPASVEALWIAAIAGDAPQVNLLLGKGIDPDTRDEHGETALMKAVSLQARGADHMAVVEALLAKHADPNARDKKGRTPLLFASQGSASEYRVLPSNEPMIRLLLSKGARINDRDDDGWSPLLTVVSQWADQPALIRFLLESGADFRATTKAGKTMLMIAASHGKEDIVAVAITKGVDVNARDTNGVTALMEAVAGRWDAHASIAKSLLVNHADANVKDNSGRTAIEKAMEAGFPERVAMLTEHGAKLDSKSLSRARNEALLKVVANGDSGRVQSLLHEGADVNYKNQGGETALMIAAQQDHGGSIVSLLTGLGADVHAIGPDGNTALHYAADTYDAEKLAPLLEKGAAPNARDNHGNTALIRAAGSRRSYFEERMPTMHLLMERGAEPKLANAKGVTALMLAAAEGNSGLLLMLEKDVAVNARDASGDTALHYAARNFVRAEPRMAARAMMEKGAQAGVSNKLGITQLMLASTQYQADGAELLIEKGADVNAQSNDGRTALLFALDGPKEFDNQNHLVYSPRIARLLIAAGAKVNLGDSSGRTALSVARARGHSDIIPFLLEHGAK